MESKSGFRGKPALMHRVFRRIIAIAVYIALRPKVIWKDESVKKYLKENPAVFVCNHTHHFDGAFAGAVLHKYNPFILVTKKWSGKKFIGKMLKWYECVPIDLNEASADWFNAGKEIIKNGGGMVIFPEGGVARNGHMEKFKPGAALLSAACSVPIVPMAIYGGYDILFGARQKIIIGTPIESRCPDNMRHSLYARKLAGQAEEEVAKLYGILEERYGKRSGYTAERETLKNV